MNDNRPSLTERAAKQRFIIFIAGAIIISVALVAVSLSLYISSGTAQLDLSRPGLEKIRDQVQNDDSFEGFSSNGSLDKDALTEFDSLYSKKLKEAESVDAFGNDVLSPGSLQIDQSKETKNTTE